ncbi:MAG: hypothetical protein DLM72_17260, partial [Candidatus Nitrosopolaris wilkensis]
MRRPIRRTLGGPFSVLTIAIMLIIGSSAFPNMALSKSSSHISSNIGGAATSTSNSGVSNLNGFHNQSSSTSHLYLAPPPPG